MFSPITELGKEQKKSMKTSGLLAAFMTAAVLLVGCGTTKTIDTAELARSLATEITYDDTLQELEQDEISMYMELPEDVEAVVYMGSGSTAEEVGVFAAKSNDEAKNTLESVQKFLDDQQDSFEDYKPEEAKRVGSAVIEQKGNYVILCVSGDSDSAKKIIEKAFQ